MKRAIAFWIWKHLAVGEMPFYTSPTLAKYTAPVAPRPDDWNGWRLAIWTRAVKYLVEHGDLTSTPALRERF